MTKGAAWRDFVVAAGFYGLRATQIHRLGVRAFRGLGAVLMFHHVRPSAGPRLRLNRGLEVTPEFLAQTIDTLLDLGFVLTSIDEALAELRSGEVGERPFAVLTFDDGYRDNLEHAEPVLRRYDAPYTIYVASGFADGMVRAWWEDLETALMRLPQLAIELPGGRLELATVTLAQKDVAADILSARLRALPDAQARAIATRLLAQLGEGVSSGDPAFMTWSEIRTLARSPLCTIGAHTLTHPRLAALDEAEARRELSESRARIEAEIGRPVGHLAYPYGGADVAGPREFRMAAELGFASAVTTRPGMIFPDHAAHVCALPRLSVNGAWQTRPALEALLSGVPFAAWNRGRRVSVG